jgi:hypothetical protein
MSTCKLLNFYTIDKIYHDTICTTAHWKHIVWIKCFKILKIANVLTINITYAYVNKIHLKSVWQDVQNLKTEGPKQDC